MSERIRPLSLPSVLTRPLPVRVWSPRGVSARTVTPLLWCHDGSGYVEHADLLGWMQTQVDAGTLPPTRIVLADAVRRMQWYSGSPRYLRTFSLALTALREQYGEAPVAVMGSSLGGLTSLAVAIRDPRVSCVLTQSGSFFRPRTDPQEKARFRWFDRVAALSSWMSELPPGVAAPAAHRLTIALTCGLREENLANNKLMNRALKAQGFEVTTEWLAGGHDFDSWRRALDPMWARVLSEAFGAQGWAS